MTWNVSRVMTERVVTADLHTPFKELVELLERFGISAIPIVDESGRVVGIVSEADLLLKEELRDRAIGREASELMSTPVHAVGPDDSISEAAKIMHQRGVKRLPVIDVEGRLVGIVSRGDLLMVFLRSDESIRREVAEEIIARALAIDPSRVVVRVEQGVVNLEGEVESRSLAGIIGRLAARIEGVVGVENRLGWEVDDSRARPYEPEWETRLSARERPPIGK